MKLNLGCGYRKIGGYINIDNRKCCNPDLLCNVCNGLPFEDDSISEIRAHDFLEHIPMDKTIFVIEEIWRVLEDGGLFEHMTPSTDGRGAFQDPTHRSFWNINSWFYYVDDAHRELIGTPAKFEVQEMRDITTVNPQYRIVHTFGKLRAVKSA